MKDSTSEGLQHRQLAIGDGCGGFVGAINFVDLERACGAARSGLRASLCRRGEIRAVSSERVFVACYDRMNDLARLWRLEMMSDRCSVPVLDTPRLRLRGHRGDDLPQCAAMWADPEVTRFIGGEPLGEQRTWARLLSYVGHWALLGFGYWAIEQKSSGGYVGEIGFADFKRDIAPAMRGRPELGFALAARFHGKGYAMECAKAVLAWADAHLAHDRTVCLIHPQNAASLRIVEKCGYETFERGTYNGQHALFLARARPLAPG
jgi:RimJ/RimL family protein N-acetyltransferase